LRRRAGTARHRVEQRADLGKARGFRRDDAEQGDRFRPHHRAEHGVRVALQRRRRVCGGGRHLVGQVAPAAPGEKGAEQVRLVLEARIKRLLGRTGG
jgi:hypothetical protein